MIQLDQSVASIVLDHPETAAVLQRLRIDFCCQGHRTLHEACARGEIDENATLVALQGAVADATEPADFDPRSLPLPELVDHIVLRHHGYLREAMPFLGFLAAKVARVHGGHEPRLVDLEGIVCDLAAALTPHLDQEEKTLFPALLATEADRSAVERELAAMQAEHLEVGRLLTSMRTVTDDYTHGGEACNSYRTLFAELERLEGDVLRHVHLENHVLAPRVAAGLR